MNLTLLATEGFGLNLNLFETNILNWAVVVFGLYKFLPGFLGKMLQKRREGILLELKDAEDRLMNATKALEKAKKDLSSAEEKASKIKADSLKRSESIRMESEKKAIEEMAQIKQSAISDESSEASRAISQLRKEAVELAIKKALDSLPNRLDSATQENLVTQSINNIEVN
ncbi:F0F1 ATP synthase subunit B [Prochlorococcus marinus]|uniref:F0F1 ATP synthase subunit B n=1 Tax=Prochlorococcus marinus TaxID=1219 RepID=UPI001ADB360F|nr:F0F1 ATP synthase subunit B [Prochlorococcus marinus]MBO8219790.1 F0F1 ATP synthase subunit B [Prochlorococcus marinus CUG1416]MBW3052149.1 ATP F0F1 synthase subunit B [Prochlorococcus marinus str. MU1416]